MPPRPKRSSRGGKPGSRAGTRKVGASSGHNSGRTVKRPAKRPAKHKIQRAPSRQSQQRLQRLLASAGFGSRRQCEELIEAGRVIVDGQTVTKLGTTVDPGVNKVLVDGTPLKQQKLVYYAVNKPVGIVTTNRDPQGRPRVIDLVPPDERVFPVGRLDRSSEGLILLTNDGDLAQRLAHPRFGIQKVYRVTVAGKVDGETMKQMRRGIYISEGLVRVDGARILKSKARATQMEIRLREGKNREIRRILARLGHKVQTLQRIAIGPLRLGDLPPGAYHALTKAEVQKLYASADAAEQAVHSEGDAGRKPTQPSNRSRSTDAPVRRSTGTNRSRPGKTSRQESKPVARRKSPRKRRTASGEESYAADNFGTIDLGKIEFNPDAPRTIGTVIGDPDDSGDKPQKRSRHRKKSTRKAASKRPTSNRRSASGSGRSSASPGKRTTKRTAKKRRGGKR